MPEVVVKIINDDGTESSFGPVTVPKTLAAYLIKEMQPYEEKRRKAREETRAKEIEAESQRRSREAEEANRRREVRGQKGLDPDGSDD